MCGLAGTVGNTTPDRAALQRALDAIEHRGPDELRVWTQDGVGLAHARLSIIDRAHGSQPVVSADGRYVVVFNGEIYNHHELRRDLVARGYPLRTGCDTEVLPYLYAAEGAPMVERLRGMFAFAVVDLHEREVFLARDGFGKKPLYVAPGAGGVAFASTLDGLLPLLGATPALDPQTIAEYLVLQYVPEGRSPWEGVEKVPPGDLAAMAGGSHVRHRYWLPPRAAAQDRTADVEEIGPELRRRIREAVKRRLESEVPLGVFLSGGLDSSVVVAEMASLRPAREDLLRGVRPGRLRRAPVRGDGRDPLRHRSPRARPRRRRLGAVRAHDDRLRRAVRRLLRPGDPRRGQRRPRSTSRSC